MIAMGVPSVGVVVTCKRDAPTHLSGIRLKVKKRSGINIHIKNRLIRKLYRSSDGPEGFSNFQLRV